MYSTRLCLPWESKCYAFLSFFRTHTCATYQRLGCSVVGHISNVEVISNIIPNLYERIKDNICVSLKCGKSMHKKPEFTEVCKQYLDIHAEEIMGQDVFSLLYAGKICSNTKSILEPSLATIMETLKT